ncbi:MAG: HD domain-containing protein [Pseudomonadota bacterium]
MNPFQLFTPNGIDFLKNLDPQEYLRENFTADKITSKEPHIAALLQYLAEHSSQKEFIYTDPVHGQRTLPEWMLKIIDTPPLLRLANVGQMTLLSHSRLTHSIGVAILALDLATKHRLEESHTRFLVSLALLHDVRHAPYSHLFDNFYIGDKKSPFDHDARLHEFLVQEDLSAALKDVRVDANKIIKALAAPENDPDGYAVKVILDRIDYNMRDGRNSRGVFTERELNRAHTDSHSLFAAIEYDRDSGIFYFTDDLPTRWIIRRFVESRELAYNRLAFDERPRLAQSLIYSEVKQALSSVNDTQAAGKLVEALSHLSDPDLEQLLSKAGLKALQSMKAGDAFDFVRIDGKTLTPNFIKLRGRINGGLGATTTILQKIEPLNQGFKFLVAIVPEGSPRMNFKLKGEDGSFFNIDGLATGSRSINHGLIKCVAIACYDRAGNIQSKSPFLTNKIRDIFVENGWIPHIQTFSSEYFMCGEMPEGAKEEYKRLIYNPDSVENWSGKQQP